MSLEYGIIYTVGVSAIMGLFTYLGVHGRPKREKRIEAHEKQIFEGGERRSLPSVEYLTPLVGFLMLFVALDASILLLVMSFGNYFTPVLYLSVILFAVMLIGVEV